MRIGRVIKINCAIISLIAVNFFCIISKIFEGIYFTVGNGLHIGLRIG